MPPIRVRFRRDTASAWAFENPVLGVGEPGFEHDTGKLKLGNGTAAWDALSYFADGASLTEEDVQDLIDTGLATKQSVSQKGQANGYASLDSSGKLPTTQLPLSVMEYKGTWNADTNSPALVDGTGNPGDYYWVSVAATRNLGSGDIAFAIGDFVTYSGTVWQKIDNSGGTGGAVASVAGKTGVVTLVKADVGLGNVENTADAAKPISSATQAALDDLEGEIVAGGAGPAAFVVASGSGIDPTGATDSYEGFQAKIAAAITAGLPLWVPAGLYTISQGLVAESAGFRMMGVSGTLCRIALVEGVNDTTLRVAGDPTSSWPQCVIDGFTFYGTSSRSTNGHACLRLDDCRQARVLNCHADRGDIGFDMVNNCFGSSFHGCTSRQDRINVGLLLGGAYPGLAGHTHSGSDIATYNCWFGGTIASVLCEPMAGGYHIQGGQLNGGGALSAESDIAGTLVIGRTYKPVTTVAVAPGAGSATMQVADSTKVFSAGAVLVETTSGLRVVRYSSRSGNNLTGIPTSGTGSTTAAIGAGNPVYMVGGGSSIDLSGVSFEGSHRRDAVRSWGKLDGLALRDCSFHSSGSNLMRRILTADLSMPYTVVFDGSVIRGDFSAAAPIVLGSGASFSGNHFREVNTRGESASPTFAGIARNMNNTMLGILSNIPGMSGAYLDRTVIDGVSVRWGGTGLEAATDHSNFAPI